MGSRWISAPRGSGRSSPPSRCPVGAPSPSTPSSPGSGRTGRRRGHSPPCTGTSPPCAARSSRTGRRGPSHGSWSPTTTATRCATAPSASDVAQLEAAVAAARSALTLVPDHLRPRAEPADRPEVSAVLPVLDAALARWRGEPYADLGDDPSALAERVRLAGSADRRAGAADGRPARGGPSRRGAGRARHSSPRSTRCTSGGGRCTPSRWLAAAARPTRSGARSRCARCWPTSSGSTPARRCASCRPRCCARTRRSAGTEAARRRRRRPSLDHAPAARRTRFRESPPLPRWPLVGRRAELARLEQLRLEDAGRAPTIVAASPARPASASRAGAGARAGGLRQRLHRRRRPVLRGRRAAAVALPGGRRLALPAARPLRRRGPAALLTEPSDDYASIDPARAAGLPGGRHPPAAAGGRGRAVGGPGDASGCCCGSWSVPRTSGSWWSRRWRRRCRCRRG